MGPSDNTTMKNQRANNNVFNRIFDKDYPESLRYVLETIIKRNDAESAFKLLRFLEQAVVVGRIRLESYSELKEYYDDVLIKLRFIAFPLLENEEDISLAKNYFCWSFQLSDYNFLEKLSAKLLNILTFEDRDKFKAGLKAALLVNNEKITDRAEIETVADWLKNYNSRLGIGLADNLKRAEYMVGLTKTKGIDERYLNRLKALFNFYEAIKVSSSTPAGFDEEIPIMVDGKLHIFRHGVLEPVAKAALKQEAVKSEIVKSVNNVSRPAAAANQAGRAVIDEKDKDLAELKQLAATYPVGSLERKAVEEEIRKQELGARN